MALKVKAQEKLQKIGTHAGKYRNGDCYGTRSHIMHGHVATKDPPSGWLFCIFRQNICLDSFFFVYLHAKCYSRKIYNRKIICKRKSHLRGGFFVFSGKIFVWIVSFSYICTRNVTVVEFTAVKLYVKERATSGVALLFCYAMLFISPGMKAKSSS